MESWAGKSWFITGASSGLGKAIVRKVLEEGGRVIATARDPGALAELVELGRDRVLAVAMDVGNAAQVVSAIAEAERFGGFDVLLNNAGYGFLGGVEESSEEEIARQMDVNFFGPVRPIRAALPSMRERGSGYIVNMSSIAGMRTRQGAAFYGASKFALEGMSEALAGELRSFGIRVLIIQPGYFRTDFSGRSIMHAAAPHPAYPFLARQREQAGTVDGHQIGNPAAAAVAIVRAMDSGDPPLRLVLGSDAYAMALDVFDSRRAAVEAWRDLSESTDFPSEK
nr:oxidoreductase [Sphingomonas sp. CDS-1]